MQSFRYLGEPSEAGLGLNKVLSGWGPTLYIARIVHHSSGGQHISGFFKTRVS